MDPAFSPSPNKAAVQVLAGKKPIASDIFHKLLPELKARAFTVSGIYAADTLQTIRDTLATIPEGSQTWDQSKKQIIEDLDPYLGDGAAPRAQLVLRVNTFQAFSTSLYQTAQADDDTTHLQYLHGECAVPTPSHEALNGIIVPKNDPFWKTHTGPWGHLGCVCYFRPMNEDMVEDEKKSDEAKAPENQNVITGPRLTQLHHDDFNRSQHFNISPDGPDNTGFTWHPGDLKIPLKDLESRYDPEVWSQFQQYAQSTMLSETQSLWDWLNSTEPRALASGQPRSSSSVRSVQNDSGPALRRLEPDEAAEQLKQDTEIKSNAGFTVRFGNIVRGHFQKSLQQNPSDPRARYLPSAKAAVQNPIQVWENNHRHYYIARFQRPGSAHTGFVVVAARIGETADEVITYFPKTENELKKFQVGKLIYQK